MKPEIFGLDLLSRKVPELLKKKVKNKRNPDKWNWKPANPHKIKHIKNIIKAEKKKTNYAALSNYAPNDKKQDLVLVFAMGNLTYGILNNLEREKIKFVYIDYPQFILKGFVDIEFTSDKCCKLLRIEDITVDLDDVKIVLWNPPKFPFPLVDFEMIPYKEGRNDFLFSKRWAQFLKDFSLLLPDDTIWIPGKQTVGSQDWQNKIGEYNLAKNIGLNVPSFIHTNNKETAYDFIKKHGKILLREFSTPPYSFPPIKIENIKDGFLNNLQASPCTFQAYIEKEFELRVILLFDKVFPCKIYSQESDLANEDWRVHDDAKVKWELTEIPKNLEKKLFRFKKKIKLNWCSIDLIYSNDKKYYFLEANRPGAHYWLEMFVGLDITNEIVNKIKEIIR